MPGRTKAHVALQHNSVPLEEDAMRPTAADQPVPILILSPYGLVWVPGVPARRNRRGLLSETASYAAAGLRRRLGRLAGGIASGLDPALARPSRAHACALAPGIL